MNFRLVVFLLLVSSVAAAQNELLLNNTRSDTAKYYIRELKKGALVVRLQSKSKAIEKLRAEGNHSYARTIESEQREDNLEIYQAFRQHFDFCDVYFIYAEQTDSLLRNGGKNFFLNDSLQVDPSIHLNKPFFLFAEHGTPQFEKPSDKTQPDKQSPDESLMRQSIVILDQNLRQLKPPFPYFAHETFIKYLFDAKWRDKVIELNKKLHAFYKASL